jgi:hypothetical protein
MSYLEPHHVYGFGSATLFLGNQSNTRKCKKKRQTLYPMEVIQTTKRTKILSRGIVNSHRHLSSILWHSLLNPLLELE